jgi:hypothetical protein
MVEYRKSERRMRATRWTRGGLAVDSRWTRLYSGDDQCYHYTTDAVELIVFNC